MELEGVVVAAETYDVEGADPALKFAR